MGKSNIFTNLFGTKPPQKDLLVKPNPPIKTVAPTSGRRTKPTIESTYSDLRKNLTFVTYPFIQELVPIIRKLTWINADFGLAVHDMVQLTNTGHKIKFDPSVKPDDIYKMRRHIEEKQKQWGDGIANMNGAINKMISQIWVAGALSTEWVVDNNLKGVKHLAFANPETIVFKWDKRLLRFLPYQKQDVKTGENLDTKHIRLNTNTFKYYGLNGDTDIPYGIPPFLTALNSTEVQGDMNQNIRYVMKQLGLLGFFEALVEKPVMDDGESSTKYETRLKNLLTETKTNIIEGMSEGLMVGYKDDHEFNFNSTTKNLNGVADIYQQNQVQMANGLKTAPEFLGVGLKGTETGISIIFTKMLSQLQNIQNIIKANLEHGYSLELRLAGYKFNRLSVEFNPSTITDELKYQQGMEYKIRNVANKYNMGIISQVQAADELGYDKPDQAEPRAPLDNSGKENKKRQDQNNDSDKKTRDKSKPQDKKK